MLAGGVIEWSEAVAFCRTWWLGDTAGGLIALPLILTWARDPRGSFRRMCTWEGGLLIAAVVFLSVISISANEPVTYLVFPALIWAALRFGPPGATLSVTVAAGAAIAFTANELGPFFRQPIDDKALSTQLYIATAALTTLFVGALVGERQRSVTELAESKQREGERALAERHRIARDLHDSVSQALFSTVLHTRTAERDLEKEGLDSRGPIARSLKAIAELTAAAQRRCASSSPSCTARRMTKGSSRALRATPRLSATPMGSPSPSAAPFPAYRSARRSRPSSSQSGERRSPTSPSTPPPGGHGSASSRAQERVSLEIRDNGSGFDARVDRPGHYGLESMRTRAGGGRSPDDPERARPGTIVRVVALEGDGAKIHGV